MKCAVALYSAEKTIICLTSNEWNIMERLLRALQMFEECTKVMNKPNSCISEVVPTICVLKRFLGKDDGAASHGVKTLRAELLKRLSTRFESTVTDNNFLLATAVDPRFKLKFLPSESRTVLINEINRMKPTESECTPVVTPQKQNHDVLWACFDEIVNDNSVAPGEQMSPPDNVTSEVSNFLALPLEPRIFCPYALWFRNQSFNRFKT